MKYILGMLVTAILFLFLILLLAVKPSVSKKITVGALAVSGISGLLIYSYGYLIATDNFVLSILKALLAVAASFVGGNKYSEISSVPIMKTPWMQIICTAVQVCALYATASAIITSLGKETLKLLRLWFSRRKDIHLIYGVHEDALRFGKELASQKQGLVVFAAAQATPAISAEISSMGCVLQTDGHAADADGKFLRRIGFGGSKRKLTLYALEKNATANIHYAKKLLQTLEACGTSPEQLQLVIFGQEEIAVSQLQGTEAQYGYGFVTAVSEPQMAARLLTLQHPPCQTLCFDADGKAQSDFEALIIGFGQVGQAVLKALVMNGQFEGGHFRIAVFSPSLKSTDGNFFNQFPQLCKEYDISFYESDARSRKLYEYLHERGSSLKYVAICTGNEAINHEIAEELTGFFRSMAYSIPVYKCSRKGVDAYAADGTVASSCGLYRSDLLCSNDLDLMAMILNHRYQSPSGKTALENWMLCDYFSRQSCRAATDFVPALLQAAGKTREQVIEGDWRLTDAQKENLSKTEHLRWCAFHYCMGFSPMEGAEFEARAEIYRQQIKQDGKATIRIGKNMSGRTHACLVGWDALDLLSQKEAAVTGKYVDYKAMDTENIMAVPQLLRTSADPSA